ncbi:hypothetical protein BH11PLA2_BH11PLA2_05610 [soil metagenome]
MAKAKTTKNTDDAPKAEYTVVARRYRPQQLADLIGQEHVASALTNALTSGRIAHAYLFTGARGTGKTSTARILAKCLNCEKGPTPTPCDKCDICLGIISGDDVDVLEIDGASNNKVEEVRDLRQNVGFRPTRARYKIYIIDEVHMLSTGAFNALLKTLEEPPSHVKFIFATTEVQKLPITILSRCQRFDFAHVSVKKLFDHLKTVVQKEGLQAEDDALHIIARRAAGSVRDSQSLLDQLLSFADGTLTADVIHTLLGTAGDERVAELATAILAKDAKGALGILQSYADRGLQMGELIDQLIDYWRGLMLLLSAGPEFADLPGTPSFQEKLKASAKGLDLDTVLAGLDVLTTTKSRTRGSSHVNTLLEMAVIRLSRLEELVSVAGLMTAAANGQTVAVSARSTDDPSKKNSTPAVIGNTVTQPVSTPVSINSNDISQLHQLLLDSAGPMKGINLSKAGTPAIIGPNALAFRFPFEYSSAYEHCADDRTVATLQAALKKATGSDWQVRLELDPVAKPAVTTNGEAPKPVPPTKGSTRDSLLALPLFKRAAELLGAQLVKFDEDFNPAAGTEAVVEVELDPAVVLDAELE